MVLEAWTPHVISPLWRHYATRTVFAHQSHCAEGEYAAVIEAFHIVFALLHWDTQRLRSFGPSGVPVTVSVDGTLRAVVGTGGV